MLIKTNRQDFNHYKINVTNPLLTCYQWFVWCTCYAYVYRPIVEILTRKTTGDLTDVSSITGYLCAYTNMYQNFRNCKMSCTFKTALRGRIMNYLCGCAVAYKTLTTFT